MKSIILPLIIIYTSLAFGQNTFKAIIKNSESKESLSGATAVLQGTTKGASSDIKGFLEIKNIPDGEQVFVFSYIGYEQQAGNFIFPLTQTHPIEILLTWAGQEMDEVVVTTTRSTRTIADIPTRIEVISREELEEKGNMKPGDIRMMLNETTGIQTQQTSATSYNSSIRIQGLDGKYTQILKDGFPLYSGFSGGPVAGGSQDNRSHQ